MTRPFKSAAGMGQLSFACAHFELPWPGLEILIQSI
jgi:hypothetical protein